MGIDKVQIICSYKNGRKIRLLVLDDKRMQTDYYHISIVLFICGLHRWFRDVKTYNICHAVSCHVNAYHVMIWNVMSCHTMPWNDMPCHVISCHVMSYAMIQNAMPCHVMSIHPDLCKANFFGEWWELQKIKYSIRQWVSLIYLVTKGKPTGNKSNFPQPEPFPFCSPDEMAEYVVNKEITLFKLPFVTLPHSFPSPHAAVPGHVIACNDCNHTKGKCGENIEKTTFSFYQTIVTITALLPPNITQFMLY